MITPFALLLIFLLVIAASIWADSRIAAWKIQRMNLTDQELFRLHIQQGGKNRK